MEGNRRIVVQRPRDVGGDITWDDHLVTWARIRQPRGDEWRGAPLVEGQRQVIMRIRYADVACTDRVSWDDRIWDIEAVLDADAGRRWLDLQTIETPA